MRVNVAVSGVSLSFDEEYSYLLCESLSNKVLPGMRVEVPFGRGNRKRPALVLSVHDVQPGEDVTKLKSVAAVPDGEQMLDAEMLSLVRWLKEHTFCTLYEACSCVLPAGAALREQCSYALSQDYDPAGTVVKDTVQASILSLLAQKGCFVTRTRLLKELSLSSTCNAPEEGIKTAQKMQK